MTFLGDVLPATNAALNAVSFALAFLAWRAIKRGNRTRHRALMLSALSCSALFLAGYLTRVALAGTHRFPGHGALRAGYLVLLGSHTLLAAVCLPLVLRTLWLALHDRFAEHRRIARWTFPIWSYVSVTGVVVYALLYQIAPRLP